jgi:preprotein translocase subunit YajC
MPAFSGCKDSPMDFLISTASAQAAAGGAAGAGGFSLQQALFMAVLIGAFYFMLIRPQNKKMKEHRDMVAKLVVGDEVATAGGLIGRVTEAGELYLSVEVAKDVVVKVQRFQVPQVLPKGTYKHA